VDWIRLREELALTLSEWNRGRSPLIELPHRWEPLVNFDG